MNKLLVVVDYQNDFVNGSLGFSGAEKLEERILGKIQQYTDSGDDVVFTMDTHGEEYLQTREGLHLPVGHCIESTEGWELYGRLRGLDKTYPFFSKSTFGAEGLFYYLKERYYDSVELVGLVSNICVLSNAVLVKTALPETEIIIDALCTASNDHDLNQKTLDIFEGLQMTVTNRGR